MTSRERLRALLDAVVAIGADLDLRSTLRAHRAGGVPAGRCPVRRARRDRAGPDAGRVHHRTASTPRTQAAIGDLPRGHGVLGLLIEDPRPIRLRRHHPAPAGVRVPAEPPADAQLPRAFRCGSATRCSATCTWPRSSGGGQFTDDDEQLVIALAVAAGAAIDNARLYAQTRRRQRWLEAAAEITDVLLGEVRRTEALQLVADPGPGGGRGRAGHGAALRRGEPDG